MMSVRHCFAKAFAPLPNDSPCFIGVLGENDQEGRRAVPFMMVGERPYFWNPGTSSWTMVVDVLSDPSPIGSDIANRPCFWFRGFFGEAYDKQVEAQSQYDAQEKGLND